MRCRQLKWQPGRSQIPCTVFVLTDILAGDGRPESRSTTVSDGHVWMELINFEDIACDNARDHNTNRR